MKGLPKFLRENLPGVENIPDKKTERERKTCPKCGSVNIRFLSGNYTFRCEKCFHRFTHPKIQMRVNK